MDRRHVIDVLNQLLQTVGRSLPMYLGGQRVWSSPEMEPLQGALGELANDAAHYVERIGRLIYHLDGRIDAGHFSLDFTSINDVSLAWLWRRLLDHQRQDVASLERCVEALAGAAEARALAEEVLGNARGHLLTLEELAPATAG